MLAMKKPRRAGLELLLVALAALAALASACTRQSKPLAVPELAEVDSIYISRSEGSSVVSRYETTDRERIAAILEHLRKHNPDEFRVETRLYAKVVNPRLPDYEYDILFLGSEGPLLAVLIGPDWLAGAHDDVEDFTDQQRINLYRRRPLSAAEREALVSLLQMQPGDENIITSHTH
jgi:hypothetical protein